MSLDSADTARSVVAIIPLVMRVVGAEMRRNPQLQDPSHVGLMRVLAHKGICSMSDLADRWSVSLPTMSRSIRRLEERDWVHSARSEHDRRSVLVELTPRGKAVLEAAYGQSAQRIAGMIDALSPDDHRKLAEGLAVLRQMFEDAVETAPHPEH